MDTPLVSVIIPTYNRAKIISRTLDNIFEQTYQNLEVIIVDDGSTDETLSVLREYRRPLYILTQANAGPAVARNKGLSVAKGEIIAFQDSDDLWMPTKLERQVRLLLKYGKSVPCCLCNAIGSDRGPNQWTSFEESLIRPRHREGLWFNVLEVLATRFVLFNQTAAIWRAALEKTGGFPEDLKYLEDYDLPLRLAIEGPWALIEDPLVIYSENTPECFSGVAQNDPIVLCQCAVTVFERMLDRINNKDEWRQSRRLLKQRLKILRRHLVAAKLVERHSVLARAAGRLMKRVDHYLFAAFRRSPWFPQPVSISAEDTQV